MYRRNLRPVVLTCTVLAGIWTLVWGVSSFQDIGIDNQTASILGTFDIILGALFMGAAVIEAFGAFSALTQRLALIRIYSLLSLVAALIVFGAEVITVVLDFKFKSDLISECTTANTFGSNFNGRGWWGNTGGLDSGDAQSFCSNLWNRAVFGDFAWLFVSTIVSLMFSAIAFAYYRQALDPASTAYPRAPSDRIRMQAYAPYSYPPPAGPPPQPEFVPPYDPAKLPSYGAEYPPLDAPLEKPRDQFDTSTTNPFERRAEEF